MAREDGVGSNGSTNLINLPDHLTTKILCNLSPESVSCASKSCSTLHKIIKSADFYNAYVQSHGWIVAECDRTLLFYNTCTNIWRPIAIHDICRDNVLCNPRMLSASGGLILFEATIENPNACFEPSNGGHKGKQKVTGATLVVVNPLTKQSRKLPDPPVGLISEQQCIEMVSLGVSYKVFLFTTRMPNNIFVYDSTVQIWKRIHMSDPLITSGDTTATVHGSTGVIYRDVLFWLIRVHPFASYLVLYDIKEDRVKRKALSSEKVHGIGVRSFGVVGVTKQGLCRLELNRLRWVDLSASHWGQVSGRYLNVDFVCSSEEDDMIWILTLDNGRSARNFKFRGWTLRKHMDLISYQFCSREWLRLCPCFVHSDSPVEARTRAISNAKWTKWTFEDSPRAILFPSLSHALMDVF